jgi:transcriptional regulator with PAS, ATPase and Fis domain
MRIGDSVILETHLPQFERLVKVGDVPAAQEESYENISMTLEDIVEKSEKRHIVQIMKECDNNKTKAAKLLDISLRSLYYKLEKYGLE